MSGRQGSSFKQADAARALKAAMSAGLKPSGYTILPDGAIVVDLADRPAHSDNTFDGLLAGRKR